MPSSTKVEGCVDGLVEGVEELENQRAKLVDKLVIKMVKGRPRNVNVDNGQGGCSYKEFLACNPNDYDGNSGAIVYTRWIEKMESVHDMNGCGDNQKFKYTAGLFIGMALIWWNIQVIRRMVAATEPTIIQSVILKAGVLTDEAIRNGSLKKNTEKRGNGEEPSRDGNVRDDNKRPRTGRHFPQPLTLLGRSIQDCREGPRIMNLLNARNLIAVRGACYECGGTDHYKAACPRAFVMEAEEAHYDQNIVTGMDWLSRHKAEIFFHEKVVRTPLSHGEMLKVLKERAEEKVRYLMSAKTDEHKLKDIVVVRNFFETAKSLTILTQKNKTYNLELFSDYDYGIRYHPGKANVVANALSKKDRIKPKRVRAMNMTIQSSIKDRILAAQNEASESMQENTIGHEYGLPSPDRWSELKAACDRQKIYADKRRKPLEFSEGDHVQLKVSPWKGVVRFGKKGKLAPRQLVWKSISARTTIDLMIWVRIPLYDTSPLRLIFFLEYKGFDNIGLKGFLRSSFLGIKNLDSKATRHVAIGGSRNITAVSPRKQIPMPIMGIYEAVIALFSKFPTHAPATSLLLCPHGGGGTESEADYRPGTHLYSREYHTSSISDSQPFLGSKSFELPPSPASRSSELPKRNPHHLDEALALMPKYAKMLKDLLSNKEKLLELAYTPLTENCSAVLPKQLPEKLEDPDKFLIPYDFVELEESGISEDVFVPMGKFTFLDVFIIVDYDVDPRVSLILGRPFLRRTDSKMKILIDELASPESNVLLPQLLGCDSTLHEELLEFDTLPSFPFRNKDKVFNPGILVHCSTYFVTNEVTQDKNFRKKTSSEIQKIENEAKMVFFGKWVSPADVAANRASGLTWVHMPRGTTQVVTGGTSNKYLLEVRMKFSSRIVGSSSEGDLAAIDTAISDEDQTLLSLTSLPSSYDNFIETLLYGRDTLKLEDVLVTLNSREPQKMTKAKGDGGEGLNLRGMNEDHVSGSRADEYDSADVMIAMSVEKQECCVRETCKVQVHMRDGSSFMLDNVRNEAAFAVAAVKKIYEHESLTFNDIVTCEVISKWKTRLKEEMDAQSDVYVLGNGCTKSSDDSKGY
uniref:Reverse transcriptase domain-containing protein n=1 Tax=Tanacetum cinerariifolium TaxID=118510 RepID=A0A6L2J8D9_TANCI|nr:hypothetical protein [Tanacetum cinerariifolium]